MKFTVGRDAEVVNLVAGELDICMAPSIIAFGIVRENPHDPLDGGVVLTNYNGSNVYVTIWMPGSLRRGLIRDLYRYVFRDLGCLRLSARTRRDNAAMRKLLPRLGFEFEGVQRQYFGPGKRHDALQHVLRQSAAERWMR